MPEVYRLSRIVLICAVMSVALRSGAQSITTIAGGGTDDGIAAVDARVYLPNALLLTSTDLYYSEASGRVRRIDLRTNVVTTVAGIGAEGFGGDGSSARDAAFRSPAGLALDAEGNLYIADSGNNRIRRVDARTGVITTFAGSGDCDQTVGDGGDAGRACLSSPYGLLLVGGKLYVTEGNRIRIIDLKARTISTFAGSASPFGGESGYRDGAARDALFSTPGGLAIDGSGNIFVADPRNGRIRRIDSAGNVTTYAGGGSRKDDGAPALESNLDDPLGIAVAANGDLYYGAPNGGLKKIDAATKTVKLVSSYYIPIGLAVDAQSNLFFSSHDPAAITKRSVEGVETRVAGGGSFVGDGRPATAAVLFGPAGLAKDRIGNLYIADSGNASLRRVDLNGVISTIAGVPGSAYAFHAEGSPAAGAIIGAIITLAIDSAGNIYAGDAAHNYRVWKIDTAGKIFTFAGGGPQTATGDGVATEVFLNPFAIAFDSADNLYVADADEYRNELHRVRMVDPRTKQITTIAGGKKGYSGDGGPARDALLFNPRGIAVHGSDIYVSDAGNQCIRRISGGTITTFAGRGQSFEDGKLATETLMLPGHLSIDQTTGDVYYTDSYLHRVRKIDARTKVVTTVAGSGTPSSGPDFSGDNGRATDAKLNLNAVSGVVVDSARNVSFSDSVNNRVRSVLACKVVQAVQLQAPASGAIDVPTAPKLSWTPSDGAFRYDVSLDTANPPARAIVSDLDETSFVPSNLLPATRYYWSVRAKGDPFCAEVSTATSAIGSFTTSGRCGVGTFDTISPANGATTTSATVDLTWQGAAGANAYDVYFGTTNPPQLVASGVTATTYAVTPGAGRYYWFIVAHAACDKTKTGASEVKSFDSSRPSDCTPGQLRVNAVSPSNINDVAASVDLIWSSSGAPVTGYDVYFGTAIDPPLLAANVAASRLTVSGLVPGTTYRWRVVAKNRCDTNGVSSAVATFTTRSCDAPGATEFLFVPSTATAGSTYTIVWSAAAGLDAGGGYVVERSTSASFSQTESQISSSTAATFVAPGVGTWYHRVRAVASCDPAKSGPSSEVRAVAVVAAPPNVVFTVQPAAVVTSVGDKLEDTRGSFTLENISSSPVQVIIGRQELSGSPPFFSIVDPSGNDAAFVTLEARKPRTFEIRYSGPRTDVAASYQGIIFVAATGQGLAVTPYAFVNLKVGGGVGATPAFLVGGVRTTYAAFPGFRGDDVSRPPLTVTIRNDGTSPMDLAAEIGPDVWLVPEAGWNSQPLVPGGERDVKLFTRRDRAPNGSALPRYTYFTVRTRDGKSARLLVQDNDQVATSNGRAIRLTPDVRTFIVPEVVSRSGEGGAAIVSRVRLSNVGSDAVQAELIFTPTGADGFDATLVRRATVLVPANDVATITDPLRQLFALSTPASGQLEVRIPRERLGLVSVTCATSVNGISGSVVPVVNRGDGARLDAPHTILGITEGPTARTALVLAETTGADGAVGRAALFNENGDKIGELQFDLPPYGEKRIDNVVAAAGGTTLANGRIEISVERGGGAVTAVAFVAKPGTERGAAISSRPYDDTVRAAALMHSFLTGRITATPSVSIVVPVIASGLSGAGKPLTTMVNFSAPPLARADFTAVFRPAAGGTVTTKTFAVLPGKMLGYKNVVTDLFQLAAGSEGSVFVDASGGGKVSAVLQKGDAGSSVLASPSSSIPLPTTLSELLTSLAGSTQRPLFAEGLEQSTDANRGSRTLLVLNEVNGGAGTVNVRLYEAGNRTTAVAQKDVAIGAYQQLTLDTVFGSLGLDAPDRRKDRTNVQVVVTATSGTARVAASAVSVDNVTGDTTVVQLQPSIGSATPDISRVSAVAPPPTVVSPRRRAVRR